MASLDQVAEGQQHTLGAYHRPGNKNHVPFEASPWARCAHVLYWPRQTILTMISLRGRQTILTLRHRPWTSSTWARPCARGRHELRFSDWIDIADLMRDAGKEAVLSTQVLLESGVEVSAMHKVTANPDYPIEANDMGAVQRLAGQRPFVGGLHLNIYNQPSLTWLASLGATRWVAPLEMKHQDLPPSSRTARRTCRPKCLPMPHAAGLLGAVLYGTPAQPARTTASSAAWTTPTA